MSIAKNDFLLIVTRYHTQQPYLIRDYLSPDNKVGNLPSPNSFLFNDTRTAPTFNLKAGKKYLIRMVSLSALACGQFHIDGHTLTVVGIDGVHVHPQDAETIIVCAGQRYDVVVKTLSNPTTSFKWICKMTTDMLTNDIPPDDAITIIGNFIDNLLNSILGSIFGNLLSPSWTPQAVLDDMTLKPLNDQPLYKNVDRTIALKTNQTYYEGIGTRIGLGTLPWVEPKVPSLYTALSTGDAALDANTYGVGVDPWVIRSNEIVQIYMENPQVWPHPMHLHGKQPHSKPPAIVANKKLQATNSKSSRVVLAHGTKTRPPSPKSP